MSTSRAGTAFAGVGTPILGVDVNGNLAPITGGADAVATNETATSGAGAAVSITWDAIANNSHVVRDIQYSYSAAPAGGALTILDGSDTVFTVDITAAGVGSLYFGSGKQGTAGRLMTLTLAAPGGQIVGKVNASHLIVSALSGGALNFGDELNSGLLPLFF